MLKNLTKYLINKLLKLTQTASSVGPDPAHIWPAWISHGPDVGRIWANTMLLSGKHPLLLLHEEMCCSELTKTEHEVLTE